MEIRDLEKRDHGRAAAFAVAGMNFDRYVRKCPLLTIYGRYFFDTELSKSTTAIAAYDEGRLAGVLLADMKGKRKITLPLPRRIMMKITDLLCTLLAGSSLGLYERTNRELLSRYEESSSSDGEICFLAVDPAIKGRGTGTFLLEELIRREKGKEIHLFTDDSCTYSFYDSRGFTLRGRKDITMEMGGREAPLSCLLYSRKL